MREAINALTEAHDELKAVDEIHHAAWEEFQDWCKKHPAPGHTAARALRKWMRWEAKIYAQLAMEEKYDEHRKAQNSFNRARAAVANIKPRDQRELTLKACAASIYEDGKERYLRRAMQNCQLILWSIALDDAALFLPSEATQH